MSKEQGLGLAWSMIKYRVVRHSAPTARPNPSHARPLFSPPDSPLLSCSRGGSGRAAQPASNQPSGLAQVCNRLA